MAPGALHRDARGVGTRHPQRSHVWGREYVILMPTCMCARAVQWRVYDWLLALVFVALVRHYKGRLRHMLQWLADN